MAIAGAQNSRGFHRIYLAGWLVVGALATSYLVLVAIKPDLRKGPNRADLTPDHRILGRLADEMQSVRKTLGDVQMSVAHLRTETASLKERDSTVSARLAAIEERASKLAPSVVTAAVEAPAATVEAQTTRPIVPKKVAAPAAPKAKQPAVQTAATAPTEPAQAGPAPAKPNLINGAATAAAAAPPAKAAPANQIVTGSLPPVPLSLAPPPAPQEAGPVALYLGGGPSLDALRLSWSLLNERHGAVLRGTSPRIARAGADGQSFDLLAGPVKSNEEARRLCAELRARRVACTVGPLTGDTL
jgi:hypothetical protein